VLLLVAYGVRRNGTRELLAFTRAKAESQAGWEGLLNDLFRRGLCGKNLQLVITDGCPGLARAIETVYPRARHQRCWVHKMRNILEKVRRRDESQVKAEAQKIYLANNAAGARRAFERFRFHWRSRYPAMVRQLERDLPELLHFFALPSHLWRKLRTTNIIERAASSKSVGAPGPWSCSPTSKAWTGSSMRFSVVSTRTGKPTPSTYLHKQLDVTNPVACCHAYGRHFRQGSERAVADVFFQGPALKRGSSPA
jgi:hypothetical protein